MSRAFLRRCTHVVRSNALPAAAIAATLVASAPVAAQRASLEARLDQLEAESEIRYLLDRYMDLLGARDWDNYVLMFAEDGELHMDEGVRKGRADIHERMATASARMAAAASGRPRRQSADVLSNIRVDVDGDTASARSRFTMLGENEDGSFHVTGSGLYLDTWIRVDGEWKIEQRTVAWDMLRGASPRPAD